MSVVKEMTKCPYCLEPINARAKRCKHCHSDLTTPKSKDSLVARYNTFRFGFLVGILFSLVMAILVYLQFSS